ncbi:MAG TPA: succinate dehydrogenase, hydrophobic membrane anchor protein [Magnetospirillaceae bacterium]|jgi:succinate dehydrogenase / fumarate reductase membrane anchor subunit
MDTKHKSMRAPLAKVRGLGSAKEGVGHFWHQRLTAIALVPLTIWFVISVIALAGADLGAWHHWISRPGNTTLMIILIGMVFYHGVLGLQVVVEDYVHGEAAKMTSLILIKFAALLLAVFSAVAVLRVAFAGG